MREESAAARRVAVVTGGASGIGLGTARRLGAAGFAIVIADVDAEGGTSAAKELDAAGTPALAIECDVTDVVAAQSARAAVVARFGGVDVLVNNAGFDIPGFFLQTDPATWDRLVAVNLMGVINCTYAFAPALAERSRATGYARIVNVASDAGRVGSLGEAVYSAAKGGVIAFTKAMARELARDRITVNAVCPGPADTPMTDAIAQTEFGAKLMERMVQATPLKRLATVEDVAGAVAYFASEEASFVTAQVVSVSGGLTIPA